jgi:hypothetical protein
VGLGSTLRCLQTVVIRGMSAARVYRVGQVYTPTGFVIDSDLRDTLEYE